MFQNAALVEERWFSFSIYSLWCNHLKFSCLELGMERTLPNSFQGTRGHSQCGTLSIWSKDGMLSFKNVVLLRFNGTGTTKTTSVYLWAFRATLVKLGWGPAMLVIKLPHIS